MLKKKWWKDRIELFNDYYNPFYIWWKCRKWFNFPHIHFHHGHIFWHYGMPCSEEYYNKFIDFHMSALGWKTKYDSFRHEYDPYIAITFFRKWQLLWTFNYVTIEDKDSWVRNIATWEAMMDILWNKKFLSDVVDCHKWGNKGEIDICKNLTWSGYFKYYINDETCSDK